jgi:hypothetical protein
MTNTPCTIRSCGLCIDNRCTARDHMVSPDSYDCPSLVSMPDQSAIALLRGSRRPTAKPAR